MPIQPLDVDKNTTDKHVWLCVFKAKKKKELPGV